MHVGTIGRKSALGTGHNARILGQTIENRDTAAVVGILCRERALLRFVCGRVFVVAFLGNIRKYTTLCARKAKTRYVPLYTWSEEQRAQGSSTVHKKNI